MKQALYENKALCNYGCLKILITFEISRLHFGINRIKRILFGLRSFMNLSDIYRLSLPSVLLSLIRPPTNRVEAGSDKRM